MMKPWEATGEKIYLYLEDPEGWYSLGQSSPVSAALTSPICTCAALALAHRLASADRRAGLFSAAASWCRMIRARGFSRCAIASAASLCFSFRVSDCLAQIFEINLLQPQVPIRSANGQPIQDTLTNLQKCFVVIPSTASVFSVGF